MIKNEIYMVEREDKYTTENWTNNRGITTEFIINHKLNKQKINSNELKYKKDIKDKYKISSSQKIMSGSIKVKKTNNRHIKYKNSKERIISEKKIKLVKETISKSKNQKVIKNNFLIKIIIITIEFLLNIFPFFKHFEYIIYDKKCNFINSQIHLFKYYIKSENFFLSYIIIIIHFLNRIINFTKWKYGEMDCFGDKIGSFVLKNESRKDKCIKDIKIIEI